MSNPYRETTASPAPAPKPAVPPALWRLRVWWAAWDVWHTSGDEWVLYFRDLRGQRCAHEFRWDERDKILALAERCETALPGDPVALTFSNLPPALGVTLIHPANVPHVARIARQTYEARVRALGA